VEKELTFSLSIKVFYTIRWEIRTKCCFELLKSFKEARYLDNKANDAAVKFRKDRPVIPGDDAHDRGQADAFVRLLCGETGPEAVPKRILVLVTGICDFNNVVTAPF